MNELERILNLAKEVRTQADLDYLEAHKDELTDEQKAQLETEAKAVDTGIIEEHEVKFTKTKSIQDLVSDAKEAGTYRTLAFTTELKDLGEGMMEAIISSEALDRHGEKINMKGMNLKEYMKNPILADGHDYSKPSVGRTHKLTKTSEGKLIAKFEWAKDITERANELYKLYKNGFQFAFSIGFIAEEMDGNTFVRSTMLEFSPVLIPANAEALLLAKKKGLDKGFSLDYTNVHMYKLNEILAKELNNLTVGEIAFLKENLGKLSDEDKAKFASVLEEKKEAAPVIDATAVAEAVKSAVEAAVAPMKEDLETLKTADPIKAKEIKTVTILKSKLDGKSEKEANAIKFLYYARGLQKGSFREYMNLVGKDAMNTTDDGVLLPPAEFIAEVERLEEQYGVARRFATLKRSANGNGVRYLSGDDDVEIFDTAEGGVKKSTRLSYAEKTLLWRKFAGILPITDELSEDSAIDLWADATARFARAFAKKEDELVFTETSGVSPKNKGILEVSGTNIVTMSGTGSDDDFEDLAYDDLVSMITGVPTTSAANGRFYFHRDLLGTLMKLKDDEGRPLWIPSVRDGAPATILGKPYETVEVMPGLSDTSQNTPFMIFGDLRYVTLGERTGMDIVIRDTGTVGDPDEEDQSANTMNLFTQDMKAMRAVKRMNAVVRLPAAFSVLKTGDVNS